MRLSEFMHCTVCISAVDGEECLMEAAKTTLDSEICKEKEKEIENALIRLQLAEKDKNREKKASAYKDLACTRCSILVLFKTGEI